MCGGVLSLRKRMVRQNGQQTQEVKSSGNLEHIRKQVTKVTLASLSYRTMLYEYAV